jgi:hypothetical protein
MYDLDGPTVITKIYKELFKDEPGATLDPNDVPYALDAILAELRAAGLHFTRWAPYIHVGL